MRNRNVFLLNILHTCIYIHQFAKGWGSDRYDIEYEHSELHTSIRTWYPHTLHHLLYTTVGSSCIAQWLGTEGQITCIQSLSRHRERETERDGDREKKREKKKLGSTSNTTSITGGSAEVKPARGTSLKLVTHAMYNVGGAGAFP